MSNEQDPTSNERKSRAPGARESSPDDEHGRRKRLERIVPELVKRGLEASIAAGLTTLSRTDNAVRGVVGDTKLPKELANYLFGQLEDTKNSLLRVVAREIREFLDATDISSELRKALTTLSFEVKTEIRFIPNDSAAGIRPEVKADVRTKKDSGAAPAPESARPESAAPEDD